MIIMEDNKKVENQEKDTNQPLEKTGQFESFEDFEKFFLNENSVFVL